MNNLFKNMKYPQNLFNRIFYDEGYISEESAEKYKDKIESYMNTHLNLRERETLFKRYRDDMTYEVIAKDWSVTRERIRQIENTAITKMRNNRAKKAIFVDQDLIFDVQRLQEEYIAKKIELQNLILDIKQKIRVLKMEVPESVSEILVNNGRYHEDTIDVLGLSVRSYNCLKRQGYNYISQLDGIHTYDLMRIRNLGRKSYNEIVTTLESKGIYVYHDELEEEVTT